MAEPDKPLPREEPETEQDRLVLNIFLAVFFVILVGSGWWIVNTMIDVRQAQDCVASGRRNCAQIEVPMTR